MVGDTSRAFLPTVLQDWKYQGLFTSTLKLKRRWTGVGTAHTNSEGGNQLILPWGLEDLPPPFTLEIMDLLTSAGGRLCSPNFT